ncbi:MAG: methyltransferase protein [Rubritepida sp.]|nr:methyltransferase protein [Rubritepida sp.]
MDSAVDLPPTASLRGIPLVCPGDGGPLLQAGTTLRCAHCGTAYPVVGGVPVLIHDGRLRLHTLHADRASKALPELRRDRSRHRVGSGSVAAWTLSGLLLSVFDRRWWHMSAELCSRLATPPLRWLDRWLRHGADAAGGCWFFGRKREDGPITDRALVQSYRQSFGMGPSHLPPPRP